MSDVLVLPEQVGFASMAAVRATGERHIDAQSEPVFDLSELADSSSAVVALLLAWFRYAHAHGKVTRFENVPAGIMNIIEVTELSQLLPVHAREGEGTDVPPREISA